MTRRSPPHPAPAALAALCLALAASACGGGDERAANEPGAGANAAAGANTNARAPGDLNAEIERLERSAERNPSDESTSKALAAAYVRRGNATREAGDLRAALKDYRSALRYDEDNPEAQESSAALSVQVEGEKTGENGEPAPLPITPGAAADDDDNNGGNNAARPAASPHSTPRKRP